MDRQTPTNSNPVFPGSLTRALYVSIHPASAVKTVSVPKAKVQGASSLKSGPLLKSFFPTLNNAAPNGLKAVANVGTVVVNDVSEVKTQIDSLNGMSTCNFNLKEVVGLNTQRFDDVSVDGDFPTGLGKHCNSLAL